MENRLPPIKSTTFIAFARKKSCLPVLTVPSLCRVAYVIKGLGKTVCEALCAASVLQEDEDLCCLAAGRSSGGG